MSELNAHTYVYQPDKSLQGFTIEVEKWEIIRILCSSKWEMRNEKLSQEKKYEPCALPGFARSGPLWAETAASADVRRADAWQGEFLLHWFF